MTIEILFSVVLLLFFGYCFIYIGNTMPVSPNTELGAEQWPQVLLGLLVILLVINIVQSVKQQMVTPQKKISLAMVTDFFKSKLFASFILITAMALILDYAGFLLTSFIFIVMYSILLGERKPLRLVLSGLVITIMLYLIFSKALGIMLPRGYGVLREFALWIEMF